MKLELKDTMYDHRIDAPPKKFRILSEYLNQHWQREDDHQGILVTQRIHLYNVAHFVSTSDLQGGAPD